MYIDDCIQGTKLLMNSDYIDPLNIGSDEMVSINQLVDIVEDIAGVKLKRSYNLDAPKGVRGRNSDNTYTSSAKLGAVNLAARRHGENLRLDLRSGKGAGRRPSIRCSL